MLKLHVVRGHAGEAKSCLGISFLAAGPGTKSAAIEAQIDVVALSAVADPRWTNACRTYSGLDMRQGACDNANCVLCNFVCAEKGTPSSSRLHLLASCPCECLGP